MGKALPSGLGAHQPQPYPPRPSGRGAAPGRMGATRILSWIILSVSPRDIQISGLKVCSPKIIEENTEISNVCFTGCLRSVTDLEREDRLSEKPPSPLLGWSHRPGAGGGHVRGAGQGQRGDCTPGNTHVDEGPETEKLQVLFSGLVIYSTSSNVSKYITSIFK